MDFDTRGNNHLQPMVCSSQTLVDLQTAYNGRQYLLKLCEALITYLTKILHLQSLRLSVSIF